MSLSTIINNTSIFSFLAPPTLGAKELIQFATFWNLDVIALSYIKSIYTLSTHFSLYEETRSSILVAGAAATISAQAAGVVPLASITKDLPTTLPSLERAR